MGRKSKAKGNAFENKTARELSLWLTSGVDKRQLIRAVSSGGWVGRTDSDEGWRQVGDLAPNGDAGAEFRRHFAVETKHHKELDFWHLLQEASKTTADWLTWWEQIVEECRGPGECCVEPLLVFTVNYKPVIVGMREAFRDLLGRQFILPSMVLEFDRERPPMWCFPFTEFLQRSPQFWYDCVDQVRAAEGRAVW